MSVEQLPQDERHAALLRELEPLDEIVGRPTRIRQELRNLLYNETLEREGPARLRAAGVACVYERYAFAGYAGARLARTLGVPHLLEVNAPLVDEQQARAGLEMVDLARGLEHAILRGAHHVLAVSEGVRRFALDCGVAPERVSVLPNGVDPERFAPDDAQRRSVRRQLGLSDACVLGFVGGLKAWHGTDLLIRALAALRDRLPALRVLIVGDGPDGCRLRDLAKSLGLAERVTFAGRRAYPEVPGYVAAMDIAVAPGVQRDDFYFSPIKVFEYMAAQRAVVVGAVGQQADLIDDGTTGRLFPPGDALALARIVEELAAAPALRKELGRAARARVLARHTWDRNAEAVVSIALALRAG